MAGRYGNHNALPGISVASLPGSSPRYTLRQPDGPVGVIAGHKRVPLAAARGLPTRGRSASFSSGRASNGITMKRVF